MTEPGERLPKTRVVDTDLTTVAARSFDQLDSLNANRLDPLPRSDQDLPEPAPYVRERLFSRKVIIGWAAATLVLWFAITFIVPEIVAEVRAEIESRMVPPTTNTAIPVEPVAPVAEPPVPVPPAILPAPKK